MSRMADVLPLPEGPMTTPKRANSVSPVGLGKNILDISTAIVGLGIIVSFSGIEGLDPYINFLSTGAWSSFLAYLLR